MQTNAHNGGYMGMLVPREQIPRVHRDVDGFHCTTCKYEEAVDRHECNVCARNWQATNMQRHVEWEPK